MRKLLPYVSRALVAFLFSLGLTLPLLGALSLTDYTLSCVAVLLGLNIVLSAVSPHRRLRFLFWCACCAGVLVYLLALGGLQTVVEIVRAVALELSGVYGALPMYGETCALMIACLLGLLCWPLTSQEMGFYPALSVLLLVMMLLWLTSRTNMLLYTLPALAALLVLFVQGNHEQLPLGRVLPLAAALVALSFALTPSNGVVSTTLQDVAQEIRQRIFDYLFFTEPRNVFSLSTEGFYPQGISQLGGSATPSDHAVMQVRTPRRVLLRGAVMNEYTGRTWRNTTGGRRYLYISPRWRSIRDTLFDSSMPLSSVISSSSLLEEETITVRMLSANASNLFLPQRVRELNVKGDLVPYFNNASEVFVTRDLAAGDTYEVTAPLAMAGDVGLDTLIEACETMEDPHYAEVLETYLQLPDHLQQSVYDLAERVTQTSSTAYEKAFALQNYLSRNYRYTLEIEETNNNYDFVTNFLFNTGEGYCTYFASAMTVLCRMVGLPARYVEGYQAIPDASGIAYVTGLQGHAWTEVYFSGFGWLTFDATPSQNSTVSAPESSHSDGQEDETETSTPAPTTESTIDPKGQEEPTPTPTPTVSPEENDAFSNTPTPEAEDSASSDAPNEDAEDDDPESSALYWLLPLLLLLAAALLVLRIYFTLPQTRAKRTEDLTLYFLVWVQAVFDITRLRRLPMRPDESPNAYAARLDAASALSVPLAPLFNVLSLVLYGKLIPDSDETELAQTTFRTLFRALRPWEKALFFLLRAFVPEKKRMFFLRGQAHK